MTTPPLPIKNFRSTRCTSNIEQTAMNATFLQLQLPPLLASRACNQRATLFLSLSSTPLISLSKPFLRRLPPSAAMSSASLRSHSSANQQHPLTELNDESDFESLLSPDGYISICGFGSLLSGTFNSPSSSSSASSP